MTSEEQRRRHHLLLALHDAFVAGDFHALGELLERPRWFDADLPDDFGGGHALVYAIYWSPLPLITRMIDAGANVNFTADDGFPALQAALTRQRPARHEVLALLLAHGADPDMRGINDWTPLHHAVSLRDAGAIGQLLAAGADPAQRTRIDNYSTPLEDAVAQGFAEGAALFPPVEGGDK